MEQQDRGHLRWLRVGYALRIALRGTRSSVKCYVQKHLLPGLRSEFGGGCPLTPENHPKQPESHEPLKYKVAGKDPNQSQKLYLALDPHCTCSKLVNAADARRAASLTQMNQMKKNAYWQSELAPFPFLWLAHPWAFASLFFFCGKGTQLHDEIADCDASAILSFVMNCGSFLDGDPDEVVKWDGASRQFGPLTEDLAGMSPEAAELHRHAGLRRLAKGVLDLRNDVWAHRGDQTISEIDEREQLKTVREYLDLLVQAELPEVRPEQAVISAVHAFAEVENMIIKNALPRDLPNPDELVLEQIRILHQGERESHALLRQLVNHLEMHQAYPLAADEGRRLLTELHSKVDALKEDLNVQAQRQEQMIQGQGEMKEGIGALLANQEVLLRHQKESKQGEAGGSGSQPPVRTSVIDPYNLCVLPKELLHRDTVIDELRQLLCVEKVASGEGGGCVAVTSNVLQAMGGMGKTVMATLLAHDSLTLKHFGGGVCWMYVGQNAKNNGLMGLLNKMNGALSNQPVKEETTLAEASAAFIKTLESETKPILLIVDDVWKKEQLDGMFGKRLPPGGSNVRLLVTTRFPSLLSEKTHVFELNQLTMDQGMELLNKYAKKGPEMEELIKLCGFHPLSLHVCGSRMRKMQQVKGVADWGRMVKLLNESKLDKLGLGLNDEKMRAWNAVHTSAECLEKEELNCLMSLAVFPAGEDVPLKVLDALWKKEMEEMEVEVDDMFGVLVDSGLIRMQEKGSGMIPLHDIVRGYVERRVQLGHLNEGKKELHCHLLRSFADQECQGGWHEMDQTMGYLPKRLGWHHIKGGMVRKWCDVLLSFRYLDARVRGGEGVNGLLRDLIVGKKEHGEIERDVKEAIDQVEKAVGASVSMLFDHPAQLASQIVGRLWVSSDKARNDRVHQLLLNACQFAPGPTETDSGSLIPLQPFIESSGASRVMNGGGSVIAVGCIEPYQEDSPWHAVSVTGKGLVRHWSIVDGECVGEHQLIDSGDLSDAVIVSTFDASMAVCGMTWEGEVVVLDVPSGDRCLLREKIEIAYSSSIAATVHPNGTLVVVVGNRGGSVSLWQRPKGSDQFGDARSWMAHEDASRVRVAVTVTASGRIVVLTVAKDYNMADRSPILLWDGLNPDAPPLRLLPSSPEPFESEKVAICAVGGSDCVRIAHSHSASSSSPSTVSVWPSIDLGSLQVSPDFVLPTSDASLKYPRSLIFSSDGTVLVGRFDTGGAVMWKWHDNVSVPVFHQVTDYAHCIAPLVGEDVKLLIGRGSIFELWNSSDFLQKHAKIHIGEDLSEGQIVSTGDSLIACGVPFPHKGSPCLLHSPSSLPIGAIVRVEDEGGRFVTNEKPYAPGLGWVVSRVAVSMDGRWAATGGYGLMALWNVTGQHATLVEEWKVEGAGSCCVLAFVSLGLNQQMLVAGFRSGLILSWIINDDGHRSDERLLHQGVEGTRLLSLSATLVDDELFIACGWFDGHIEARRGDGPWLTVKEADRQWISSILLSPDGRFCVANQYILRCERGDVIWPSRDIGVLGRASFSPDSHYLAIYGYDVIVFQQPTSGDWVADPPLCQWILSGITVTALTWHPTTPNLTCLTRDRRLIQLALSGSTHTLQPSSIAGPSTL